MVEQLQDQTVVSPNNATFSCVLKLGQPEANIEWLKAGKPISMNQKFVSSRDRDTVKLEITNTTPEDAAEYEVVVENKIAKISSKASLTVQGRLFLYS